MSKVFKFCVEKSTKLAHVGEFSANRRKVINCEKNGPSFWPTLYYTRELNVTIN